MVQNSESLILVVDDTPVSLRATQVILEKSGWKVVPCSSGQEALIWLETHQPSLIVLDVHMPGMSGFELAQHIREKDGLSEIPIIFVTAVYRTAEFIEHGFDVGAYDYIQKPADSHLLRNKIKIFLKLYHQQQTLLEVNKTTEKALREIKKRWLALQEEIDERRRAEIMREAVVESAFDSLITINESARIIEFNTRAEETFGWLQEEILGRDISEIVPLDHFHPEQIARIKQRLVSNQKGPTIIKQDEVTAIRSDGRRISVDLFATAVHMETEFVMTIFLHDITERKCYEEQTQYAAFQAGVAEMSTSILHNIGNTIAGISHHVSSVQDKSFDLLRMGTSMTKLHNTVMNRFRKGETSEELLQELLEDLKKAGEWLEKRVQSGLIESSQKIGDIVSHMSEIICIQQNSAIQESMATDFNLNRLIGDAISMQLNLIEKYRVDVQIESNPELEEIRFPRNQLLQVMVNLIKNSIEAIAERMLDKSTDFSVDAGKIKIRIHQSDRTESDRTEKNWRVIQVTDNGVGISQKQYDQIFVRGYSTKSNKSVGGAGAGYGLHAAANFIQSQGGTIEAVSPGKNQGATLTIRIPVSSS